MRKRHLVLGLFLICFLLDFTVPMIPNIGTGLFASDTAQTPIPPKSDKTIKAPCQASCSRHMSSLH